MIRLIQMKQKTERPEGLKKFKKVENLQMV